MGLFQFLIPEDEVQFGFSHSSGPGGQNVNKVSTKVTLRWNLSKSSLLTDEQKELARNSVLLRGRINREGEIVLHESSTRSQADNKRLALEKLQRLVQEALTERAERKETKTPRKAIRARLKNKRFQKEKKEKRKPVTKEEMS